MGTSFAAILVRNDSMALFNTHWVGPVVIDGHVLQVLITLAGSRIQVSL